MCGIFGMVLGSDALSETSLRKNINLLFKLTESRGRQASGLALCHNEQISIYTAADTASKVIRRNEYRKFIDASLENPQPGRNGNAGATAFIGHCRLVTNGSELNPWNNHPIHVNDIVGVHNGVITNSRTLSREDLGRTRHGQTDTEILFALLDKHLERGEPRHAVSSVYGKIVGSAAIAFFTAREPMLVLATNFGSLYYAFARDASFFVFGSEQKILADFLSQSGLPSAGAAKQSIAALKPGTGVIVPFDRVLPELFEFSPTQANGGIDRSGHAEKNFRFEIVHRNPSPSTLRRCRRCILPESYPLLSFDDDGVCSQCAKYERQVVQGRDALEKFLSKYRSKTGEPDCLIGISGGRDSCYGLYLLKNEFGMTPIAYNFDWLMTSMKARHNIAKVTGALGVEVIYRCGDYERHARNLRRNILAWLRKPRLGMVPLVQAGDKEFYHYGRKIRKEVGVELTIFCSGYQMEQREFFVGFCGIDKTLKNNMRLYDYGLVTKARLALYYGFHTLINAGYWHSGVLDSLIAFYHSFIGKDDSLYLFQYFPWKEMEVERVLNEQFQWEADTDYGENQWRMGDAHTAFINYIYYTIAGFSEFDNFRSNQIREGLISRDEALRLTAADNEMRYESLRTFAELVGINLEYVIKRINAVPKLY